VIIGVEPDAPEDVSDVHKLLAPDQVAARPPPAVGRNALCPCGSGRKYKRCCLTAPGGSPGFTRKRAKPESEGEAPPVGAGGIRISLTQLRVPK